MHVLLRSHYELLHLAGAPCSLMERALEHLQGEMANLRTGRASPGMLDHLKVGCSGEPLAGGGHRLGRCRHCRLMLAPAILLI
jgi:hypothetical protein